MKDVAAAAGVGKSTVSLALRNDPRLRPETCARIQKIATEMGYRSNPTVAKLMAQLRTSRTNTFQGTLAILNAADDQSLLTTNPTYGKWYSGCIERAKELGYAIDTFWLQNPEIKLERLCKILHARNIQGVLLMAVTSRAMVPENKFWTGFSSVSVGQHLLHPDLNFTTNDQYATVVTAVKQLLKIGYHRPGLVLDPARDAVIEYRLSAGFWAAQQSLLKNKERVPQLKLTTPDIKIFHAWLKKTNPDVIVTIHPEVLDWLLELGLRVPQDIGLIHPDLTDSKEHQNWAGMEQRNDAVGAAAVDMLVAQIHRSEFGIPEFSRSTQIESVWKAGKTVKTI